MATQYAVASFRLKDDTGVIKAFEVYVNFNDAVATWASVAAAMSALAAKLDDITEAQILSMSLKITYTLPMGLKAAAVAGCDVEETGLITFVTSLPGGKAYGQDIPAYLQAAFVGNTINQLEAGTAAWIADMLNAAGTFREMDNRFGGTLDSVKSANKTFRKSRRALKRA